jgi:hypothetical protein
MQEIKEAADRQAKAWDILANSGYSASGATNDYDSSVVAADVSTKELTVDLKAQAYAFDQNAYALEGMVDTGKASFKDLAKEYEGYAKIALDASKSVITTMAADLAMGQESWKGLGTAAIRAVGRIISALGDMAAVQAAIELGKWIASWFLNAPAAAAAAQYTLGAAAAWTAGAALQAITLHEGGSFTVPQGYPDDSFPLRVESGEHVSVTPAGQADAMPMQVVIQLDGSVIANWLGKATKNQQVIIHAGAIV